MKLLLLFLLSMSAVCSLAQPQADTTPVQLGLRPFYLIDQMPEGPLKARLAACRNQVSQASEFSIGHRGAPLQFPEHTRESYRAAALMGAGIIECDVTFTKDKELVCRHSQCDLHTTTNILQTGLAQQCSQPFSPARFDEQGILVAPASARCCTSDITLAEFKTLKGKMDGFDPQASTADDYVQGTPAWRTDLYAAPGTLLSYRESIALFQELGVKMTPELKAPMVDMPFEGLTRETYAQKLIDELKQAGVGPADVYPQSFDLDDVRYWIKAEPDYGRQAIYLDGRDAVAGFDFRDPESWQPGMQTLKEEGVNVLAPPFWMLMDVEKGQLVPSEYARQAKAAGLALIGWTLERSGHLSGGGGWNYQSVNGLNPNPDDPQPSVINSEGDVYRVLDLLAGEVGVAGVFSDWPATVTYYANCMGLQAR